MVDAEMMENNVAVPALELDSPELGFFCRWLFECGVWDRGVLGLGSRGRFKRLWFLGFRGLLLPPNITKLTTELTCCSATANATRSLSEYVRQLSSSGIQERVEVERAES